MLPRQAQPRGGAARLAAGALTAGRALILPLAAALAIAAGCGGDDDAEPVEPPEPPPAASEGTELTVTLYREGLEGSAPETAELSCPGEGVEAEGGGPAACGALEAVSVDDADPVPRGVACTQIYGGPDVVRIDGTLHGERIDAELTRANGCEIDRFERFSGMLEQLFPGYEPGEALMP